MRLGELALGGSGAGGVATGSRLLAKGILLGERVAEAMVGSGMSVLSPPRLEREVLCGRSAWLRKPTPTAGVDLTLGVASGRNHMGGRSLGFTWISVLGPAKDEGRLGPACPLSGL